MPDTMRATLLLAAYRAFYDLVACSLETGNKSGAQSRLIEAEDALTTQYGSDGTRAYNLLVQEIYDEYGEEF